MQLTRLQSRDREEWHRAGMRFAPNDDIYFQPEYAAACEANGDGEAECLLVQAAEAALLLPVLRCSIPNHSGFCDIQSPYGYGGPLVVNESPQFLQQAWLLIREHWERTGVVAAFLRNHPLAENERWFGSDWEITYDRDTVSVNLQDGVEAAFAHPEARKHRRDTAQARRTGAQVRFLSLTPEGLARFRDLYVETMSRLGAGEEYFFSASYFEALARNFGEACSLVEVSATADGSPLAMAIVFWGSRWAHYHLSARQSQGGNASHLLLQSIAEEAASRGLSALHLGGGRTPSPDDSLFRFKQWVGNARHRFYTARMIVNRAVYNDLAAEWQAQHPAEKPVWFLRYRQKVAATSPSILETT